MTEPHPQPCCFVCVNDKRCPSGVHCPNNFASCQYCAWFVDCLPCRGFVEGSAKSESAVLDEIDAWLLKNPTAFGLKPFLRVLRQQQRER
jgi:hypothetical protein